MGESIDLWVIFGTGNLFYFILFLKKITIELYHQGVVHIHTLEQLHSAIHTWINVIGYIISSITHRYKVPSK
jgi:hypothetical protein